MLKPGIIASGLAVFLYGLIFWSVNKGVSVDEGYYLLGYLKDQPVGPAMSDFHRIVRSLLFFIPENNVLMFRWVRVVLTILLLLFFLHTALRWLEKQYGRFINRRLYYAMGMLAGTLCFAYASPVIYYDNIQLMTYLLAFSLFFLIRISTLSFLKYTHYLLIGLILVFGLTNYPTSGIMLLLVILLFTALYEPPRWKKVIVSWLVILAGILIGAIIYSLFIHDIRDFFRDAVWAYENSAKSQKDKYHTEGQFLVIGNYLLGMLKVYLPLVGMAGLYFLLIYRKLINRYIINTVFGIALLVYTYKYSVFFSNILLLPVLLILTDSAISLIKKRDAFRLSANLWYFLFLVLIPVMAVAGSNQRLEMKMVFFMPFWFLAYVFLLAEFKDYLHVKQVNVWHTVFIMVFFIVFAAQGFLKHIHYNYSIKRSTHRIENAVRFKNIGVSEYQCEFYENGIRELKKAGFKPGDEVLAFFETFMLVYAAGGYVPHRLTYSAEFFIGNVENIPHEKPRFIIINEYQVPMLTEFLEDTDWNFPLSYHVLELGTDGHNLTQLGYNYKLFYKN